MKLFATVAALFLLAACTSNVTGGAGTGTGGTSVVDVPCTDCLSGTLTWGFTGGFVQYTESSSLSACRSYAHQKTLVVPYGDPTPAPQVCAADLPGCGAGSPGVHEVEQALAHPDVAAALAGTTPLYGTDPRPCDGGVMSIQIGGMTIEVGGECGGDDACFASPTPCVPVPAGLRALVNVLEAVDQEELAVATCTKASQ